MRQQDHHDGVHERARSAHSRITRIRLPAIPTMMTMNESLPSERRGAEPRTKPRTSPADTLTPAPREPLWREAVGDHLRKTRHKRNETLSDVAKRAGVSPQYLSEIERGRKEPSSEMLAAISGALGLTLIDLTFAVTESLIQGVESNPRMRCRADFALAA